MTFKGIPDEYFAARGVSKSDLVKTKALKLPADPYMHLVLNQFKKPKVGPQWPAPYDQLGSRAHAFLVKSLDAEMTRIAKDSPKSRFFMVHLASIANGAGQLQHLCSTLRVVSLN